MPDQKPKKAKAFASTPLFYTALGYFYAIWSRTDLAIDCAIWKASGTATPEEVHETVAAMKFSDKCKYFRSLIASRKDDNAKRIRELLTKIEEDSGRNIFAHSFIASDESSVAFIHRQARRGKGYHGIGYRFTRDQFLEHVKEFETLSLDFEKAVGLVHKEVADFASMALPVKEVKN